MLSNTYYGPVNDNGEWRVRHNKGIRNVYRSSDITTHVRARRLGWACHVLHTVGTRKGRFREKEEEDEQEYPEEYRGTVRGQK